ncbi:MAG: CCE_0567 family metalloprotein [Pseudomonadota bacterium]
MTEEELKDLEKKVRKLKRRATEWAGKVHDLVEERIPADYRELPELTQSTVEACRAWEEADNELKAAKG